MIKTWQKELGVILLVLLVGAGLNIAAPGADVVGVVLSTLAVTVTFMHAQVSDRLREYAEGQLPSPPECMALERTYFILKEILWVGFFLWMWNFPALIGAVAFLAYRRWRTYYRSSSKAAST